MFRGDSRVKFCRFSICRESKDREVTAQWEEEEHADRRQKWHVREVLRKGTEVKSSVRNTSPKQGSCGREGKRNREVI